MKHVLSAIKTVKNEMVYADSEMEKYDACVRLSNLHVQLAHEITRAVDNPKRDDMYLVIVDNAEPRVISIEEYGHLIGWATKRRKHITAHRIHKSIVNTLLEVI